MVVYKTAGGYVTASEDENGAQLTVSNPEEGTSVKDQPKYLFEYADWGQDAFSLLSLANQKWINAGVKNNSFREIQWDCMMQRYPTTDLTA